MQVRKTPGQKNPKQMMRTSLKAALAALMLSCGAGQPLYADDARWVPYETKPPVAADNVDETSYYLTMPDGVKIAVTVYLPKDRAEGDVFPSLLRMTRYMRAIDGQPHEALQVMRRYVGNGYAHVIVDVRGTGASFGRWAVSRSPQEVQDFDTVLDWIQEQDWSDGQVGVLGGSYEGGTADLASALGNDAIVAAMPTFSSFDVFADVTSVNGVRNSGFMKRWSQTILALDLGMAGYSVLPVDPELLPAAIAAHEYNGDMYKTVMDMHFRDDFVAALPTVSSDDTSPHTKMDALNASGIPFYGLTGWFDSSFTEGSIKRFLSVKTPGSKLTIGPWHHGGQRNVMPLGGNPESSFDLVGEYIRYFDAHLKGMENGIETEAPVHYYTMMENVWKSSDVWPPESETKSFFLSSDGQLSGDSKVEVGEDQYAVTYETGMGPGTRWGMLLTDSLTLDDIHREGSPVLSYTSPALAEDTEVTGHPKVFLSLTSDQPDGQFFAYLEDVAPDGTASYVTEGLLRGLHRKVSDAPYNTISPYHSQLREDASPLPIGEPFELTIGLMPTSYLFREGHSIRIVITGADKDNFEPLPLPPANLTVLRGGNHPSRIELPVVR